MRLALLALALALVAACGPNYAQRSQWASPGSYELGPRDIVTITLMNDRSITFTGSIGPTGEIALPLVGGVRLEGETFATARQKLTKLYRAYYQEADVAVLINAFNSNRVHIMGEVGRPGSYLVEDLPDSTVMTLLMEAGSFNVETAAYWDTRVLRGRLTDPEVYKVDIEAMLMGESGEDAMDLLLQPGDVVFVPPRWETRLDRFIRQFMSPITALTGSAGALVPAVTGAALAK